MVNLDEPPFLAVGTEVSAKFKGAFCEAKIQKISKSVKCKVQYSNGTSTFVTDDAVKGQLKVGGTVYIKCSDKKKIVRATIKKIQDCSQYTVVFDDGDVTCLKRKSLCLKSGRHFAASTTLDQLPIIYPEHIGVPPVKTTIGQGGRNQKHKKSFGESGEEKASEMDKKYIGKVVCVETSDKKKVKDNWFPGLIVAPTSQSLIKTNVAEDYLVRSFKDGKYYAVPKKEITEFTKEICVQVKNPTLKTAIEKAQFFLDKDELPLHWNRDLLFGVHKICSATDTKSFDDISSDEESIEEKDNFVAQLFKFMDERATPINQTPVINEKDVDLFKLFKIVYNCGGYTKVNRGELWKFVANKAGHGKQSFSSVKNYYQQYLYSFENFYRKLGCTMFSHPKVVRSRSTFSRSIIRNDDKELPSTSSAIDKNKRAKNELNSKKYKDSDVTKKTAKTIKTEEKLIKNNRETSKKGDSKKKDITFSTSCNKLSVKRDPDITETIDPVKTSITKKGMKEIIIKEIKIEKDLERENTEDKKVEKKICTRNAYRKSMQKTENDKVVNVKCANTGLPVMRKTRTDINSVVQLTQPITFVEHLIKIKKEDEYENKKPLENKKDNKEQIVTSRDIIPTPINIEHIPFDKNTPVAVGDNLIVYHGHKIASTYDAKVISVCNIKGVMKYYVHYKGWNRRYDEWIDSMRIAYKKKDLESAPEIDNNEDFSKSSPPEQTNVDSKKIPLTTNKRKRPISSLTSNSNKKKSTFSSARPTRKCTLNSRPLFNIDDSNSEEEYAITQGSSKQHNGKNVIKSEPGIVIKTEPLDTDDKKKPINPKIYPSNTVIQRPSKQHNGKNVIKSEPGVVIKTEPLDTDDKKKPINPKIYPSNTVIQRPSKPHSGENVIKSEPGIVIKTEPLDTDDKKKPMNSKIFPSKKKRLQQSEPRKPNSYISKVHTIKSEEVEICEQVLSELQCTEEIVGINGIHKPEPNSSNGFFDSIHQPSTSKSFYNPKSDVDSALFCEEIILNSPICKSEEEYDQEEGKKTLQELKDKKKATSPIYAINNSFCRPLITLMGATEEETEEYTNILQKDGAILDKQNVQFLSEISSRHLSMNINEPSITKPVEREPEAIIEKIVKPPKKRQSKRRTSSHENISKRSKLFTITSPIYFDKDMDSQQKQAVYINKMNKLKKVYSKILVKLEKIQNKKKRIIKRNRKNAKAAKIAATNDAMYKNILPQAADGASTSK